MGRLMKAPDHDSGTGTGGASGEGEQEPVVEIPENETPEQKVEREAREAEGKPPADETPEQKVEREAREAEEARAPFYGAPAEDGTYEITGLPDGMELDAAALEAITPVARQLNLSSEGLSLLARTYAEHVLPGVGQRFQSDLETRITTQSREWEQEATEAMTGKVELKNAGGEVLPFDGKTKTEIEAVSARALDKLAPEGLRAFLAESGLGNHPAMVAFTYQAGKLIKEETEHEGSGPEHRSTARTGPAMTNPDKFYSR